MAKPAGELNESAERNEKRNEKLDGRGSILRQPKAVWAVAFAWRRRFVYGPGPGRSHPSGPRRPAQRQPEPGRAVVHQLHPGHRRGDDHHGVVSSRLGHKRTLLAGLGLIVVFSALSGTSGNLGEVVGFRAGWGLGNALFIATALAVIVEVEWIRAWRSCLRL